MTSVQTSLENRMRWILNLENNGFNLLWLDFTAFPWLISYIFTLFTCGVLP